MKSWPTRTFTVTWIGLFIGRATLGWSLGSHVNEEEIYLLKYFHVWKDFSYSFDILCDEVKTIQILMQWNEFREWNEFFIWKNECV